MDPDEPKWTKRWGKNYFKGLVEFITKIGGWGAGKGHEMLMQYSQNACSF